MGGVEEGQGLAARSEVDLRRSSKSQRLESMVMLPSHPKGPMMGASMGSMPGGAAWCFPCFLVWFWDCDGSLDYVSVLASSTVEAVIELPTSLQ